MQGMVPNFGLEWLENGRNGRMVTIPKSRYYHSSIARKMRDQSIMVHGGQIFNILPHEIRNWTQNLEGFKKKLDKFLELIPDQPAIPGLVPEPVNCINCRNSNSLYDWITHLKLSDRRPDILEDPNTEESFLVTTECVPATK